VQTVERNLAGRMSGWRGAEGNSGGLMEFADVSCEGRSTSSKSSSKSLVEDLWETGDDMVDDC
jgi:hypothetical protein